MVFSYNATCVALQYKKNKNIQLAKTHIFYLLKFFTSQTVNYNNHSSSQLTFNSILTTHITRYFRLMTYRKQTLPRILLKPPSCRAISPTSLPSKDSTFRNSTCNLPSTREKTKPPHLDFQLQNRISRACLNIWPRRGFFKNARTRSSIEKMQRRACNWHLTGNTVRSLA